MASRKEAETHYWHDHFDGTVYVESTRRGVWNKAERLGMALDITGADYRRYKGPESTFRIAFRRRSLKRTAPVATKPAPSRQGTRQNAKMAGRSRTA